jgi:predicted Holliday junction resolvase-like endonuclease
METITTIISLVALIVFFVMSANIAQIKKLADIQTKQNRKIIELLRINTPQDKLEKISENDFSDAKKNQTNKPKDKFGRTQ